jgi:hypothetical protein
LLLTAALGVWYAAVRRFEQSPVARNGKDSRPLFFVRNGKDSRPLFFVQYHVVAVKYAVFVFLLSGDGSYFWSLALAMALIYLSFTIYEVVHDRSLQATPGAELALRFEIGALSAVSALMTLKLAGGALLAAVLQGLLAVVGVLVLAEVFGRRRVHRQSARAGYLVFAVAFALSVNFSLGVRL